MKYNSKKIEKLFTETKKAPVYIICEIGINHNGSLEKALQLIDAAHDAGVDAVKFQKRNLTEIYVASVLENSNNSEWTFDYLMPILKEFELAEDDYHVIKKKCEESDLDLIITPFDEDSAEFVGTLDPAAIKIASADMTNFDLIRRSARICPPLLISTGMWSEKDIEECVTMYKKEGIRFALLHTQSTYPAPYDALNLGFINKLKRLSPFVGYSGHERGGFVPIAAIAMGCKIIEKHITFDKNDKGPDHKASMLPAEWKQMVENIRNLEYALGTNKHISQGEALNKEAFAKSAVARATLRKGHILHPRDIMFRSPGKGIFQHEVKEFFGLALKKDVPQDTYISKFDFEDEMLIKDWKRFTFQKKWGVKCRFHDFEEYRVINSSIMEFHCSETDLYTEFEASSKEVELVVHSPEIFNRELVDICSDDKEKTDRSLEILQRSIDMTIGMSKSFPKAKPKLVMHLGGMFLDTSVVKDTRTLMQRAVENFKRLEFSKNDVEILPENLPPRPWYLGGEWYQHGFMTADDMTYFCEQFDLGMAYDICHAYLYCTFVNKDLCDYTKAILPYIRHIHISDAAGINGEGLQMGRGEIDFDSLFALLEDAYFSWVPEIWCGHLHHGTGVYKALCALEKYKGSL